MAIPKAMATKRPILDFLSDGAEHIDDEIQEAVASHFGLTSAEREVLQKNGIPVYKNRTAWGLVYLQHPELNRLNHAPYIMKTGVRNNRGEGHEVYAITTAGMKALRQGLV